MIITFVQIVTYIFAPMFKDWTSEIYKKRIYNDEYEKYVDPEHDRQNDV